MSQPFAVRALLLLMSAQLAWCQSPAAPEAPLYEIPDQVITGNLRRQKKNRSVATLVEKSTLQVLRPLQLSDTLQTIPGLQVLDQGSMGSLSTLQLRGYGSSATLVSIDGRPINSPSLGGADLSTLSVQGLDRVEVVRGPYSALYGPNSMAGVVNLVTAEGGEATPSRLQFLGGGQKTTAASALLSARLDDEIALLFVPEYRQSAGNRANAQSTLANGMLKLTARPDASNRIDVTLGPRTSAGPG